MASVGVDQAPFHQTLKELAHFILPTSENVKGEEEEEEGEEGEGEGAEAKAVLIFSHR